MIEIGTVLNSNGAGQSFTAGLLYILRFHQDIHALNFATAAYALNYSAIDDYNTASINQIINTYQSSRMSQGEIVI
jgi:2-dehydro-3-deoxygluconokinase